MYGKKGAYLLFFDAQGKQVKEVAAQVGENKINISALHNGFYLVVLAVDGYNVAHTKLVKE